MINDGRIESIALATRAQAGSSAELETALMLAEESGEAIQQLRRHLGLARRSATVDEVAAELADVAIVVCVLSRLLDIDLDLAMSRKLDEGIR
jgi:NTP pyrophosphatase (non-canonical NTP hydrolase)